MWHLNGFISGLISLVAGYSGVSPQGVAAILGRMTYVWRHPAKDELLWALHSVSRVIEASELLPLECCWEGGQSLVLESANVDWGGERWSTQDFRWIGSSVCPIVEYVEKLPVFPFTERLADGWGAALHGLGFVWIPCLYSVEGKSKLEQTWPVFYQW